MNSPKEIAADLISKIKGTVRDFAATAAELKKARGFWNVLKTAKDVLPSLVRQVEGRAVAFAGGLSGAEKREIALEAIMLLLPDLPWWAPKWLVRKLLGRAIDKAVDVLNEHYGKRWPGL